MNSRRIVLGIVGSEGAKFTKESESLVSQLIETLILQTQPSLVVSGACHLGGVDQWAVEIAKANGIQTQEFPPLHRSWGGYKARNIQIAEAADEVVCFTVEDLPPGFPEGGWERYCYHCKTDEHIKSGGCWTAKYARNLGKVGRTVVVSV
jgi:hypothetical protein